MRYYSDVTKQLYDTKKELVEAEEKFVEEETAKAKVELEDSMKIKAIKDAHKAKTAAYGDYLKALKEYRDDETESLDLEQNYIKAYKAYHKANDDYKALIQDYLKDHESLSFHILDEEEKQDYLRAIWNLFGNKIEW